MGFSVLAVMSHRSGNGVRFQIVSRTYFLSLRKGNQSRRHSTTKMGHPTVCSLMEKLRFKVRSRASRGTSNLKAVPTPETHIPKNENQHNSRKCMSFGRWVDCMWLCSAFLCSVMWCAVQIYEWLDGNGKRMRMKIMQMRSWKSCAWNNCATYRF